MKDENYLKEGFWWSKLKENKNYPKPVPTKDMKWITKQGKDGVFHPKPKKRFLRNLYRIEELATKRRCKGWSTCRICEDRVGSTTYFYKGWQWPEGFEHYIHEHNIKPTEAFITFINIFGSIAKLIEDDKI